MTDSRRFYSRPPDDPTDEELDAWARSFAASIFGDEFVARLDQEEEQ